MKNDRTIFDLSINEKNKFIKHYIGIDMGKAGGDKSINIKVDMRGVNPKFIVIDDSNQSYCGSYVGVTTGGSVEKVKKERGQKS